MSHVVTLCLVTLYIFFPALSQANNHSIPRTIIGLYDSKTEEKPAYSLIHQYAEMPLNHLGLKLELHDVNQPLPNIARRKDVRGILTWFPSGKMVDKPEHYIAWAQHAIEKGKYFVIIGDPGFISDYENKTLPPAKVNSLLEEIGLYWNGGSVGQTYQVTFPIKDKTVVDFERNIGGFLHPFFIIQPIRSNIKTFLSAQEKSPNTVTEPAILVAVTGNGGYIATGYGIHYDTRDQTPIRQWYVNPFEFFRQAYKTQDLPKPDTTTLAGRRIYYNQINGSGWLNKTQIDQFRGKLASEIILEQIIKPHADLPASLALNAGDIDEEWYGHANAKRVAQDFYVLPYIEAASMGYSHIYDWSFFEEYDRNKERPYLKYHKGLTWNREKDKESFWSNFFPKRDIHPGNVRGYKVPRGYVVTPFNTAHEISGSIAKINGHLTKKKIRLFQWSGNALPYAEALALVEKNNLPNLGGGNTRFDKKYPSYAHVSPIGRFIGGHWQVYASAAEENIYTKSWTEGYYRFRHVIDTFKNTESPKRIKPINLHYHIFSGEHEGGIKALKDNLRYIKTQPIIPIMPSEYAKIAQGFFTTSIQSIGKNRWKITDRGNLQTIRFDDDANKSVNYIASKGVLGHRKYQNSLYVFLDPNNASPIIALIPENKAIKRSHLVQARWPVEKLERLNHKITFQATGYGRGEMTWHMHKPGKYEVASGDFKTIVHSEKNGLLSFAIPAMEQQAHHISITYIGKHYDT